MAGGPSHVDLFDPKPILHQRHGEDMPASVLGTQRVTLMTRNQGHFQAAATPYRFARHGQSGQEMSELLPHLGTVADELCIIRSIHTEPINHDPAVTFMQTGRPQPGLPCMGSWLSYGLGSENRDLPAFVVMLSGPLDQPIPSRYYHCGFLPGRSIRDVQFQADGDPVLYLTNPPGIDAQTCARQVDRRDQRAQSPAPGAGARPGDRGPHQLLRAGFPHADLRAGTDGHRAARPGGRLDCYGPEVQTPGTFARNCLLARRLVERGVRFVQLFHRGWDQHSNVVNDLRRQTLATDQPAAALLNDLKERGLLDDTLVIWGGEFGRTAYGQGDLAGSFGRDHHPRCFTFWLAGGGIKAGITYGATDDFGYNVAENPVHVNDLHATILHCLGIDHERLTYRFGGRDFRLTDVAGDVVRAILS